VSKGRDGQTDIWGVIVRPTTFDPSRKYPVIAYIYGEVASQTVRDRWGGGTALFNRALADAGYIVVSFDNRGTPAPKGAEWRKVVYGSLGDLSSKEQAAAMRALAARYSFVDGDHMGIWGWSGGGSNTLNAMFRFPDVYKVGVAIAPMPDQQLYDSIYGALLKLPDHIEVFPAHFGGSACGKGLSGKPGSTIGFERRFNPALQFPSKAEFVRFVLADLPPQPEAFAEHRRQNLGQA